MEKLLKRCLDENFYIGGFNCAETTLLILREAGAIKATDEQMKMMTGFGGGMTKGYLCGSIVAATAALGILYGRTNPGGDREKSKEMVNEYIEKFSLKFNQVNCDELIKDFETKTDEQYKHCKLIIEASVDAFLETVIGDNESLILFDNCTPNR